MRNFLECHKLFTDESAMRSQNFMIGLARQQGIRSRFDVIRTAKKSRSQERIFFSKLTDVLKLITSKFMKKSARNIREHSRQKSQRFSFIGIEKARGHFYYGGVQFERS